MLLCGEGLVLFNERRVIPMTTYETLMIVLTVVSLLVVVYGQPKK
jgi:hypothetical protein